MMGIDLNKPIDFRLRGGKGSGGKYPAKTTMNLAQAPDGRTKVANMVVYGIFAALVLVLLLKIAVFDRFAEVIAVEQQVGALQLRIQDAQAQLAGYQDVQEEYARYSYDYQTDSEAGLVDRLDMLDVITRYVAPYGTISSVTLAENTAAVTLASGALGDSSQLIATLEKQPSVTDVVVNTAVSAETGSAGALPSDTQTTKGSVVTTVVITFQKTGDAAAPGDTSSSPSSGTATSGTGV